MAKVHTFTDDFATESSAKWGGFSSDVYVASGQLTVVPTSSYHGLFSQSTYDLTGSYAMVELVQAPPVGNGSIEAGITMQVSSGNTESFLVAGTGLSMRETISGSHNDTWITYNATAHRWLRIREAAGTVYWETSPDTLNWTTQRSKVSGLGSLSTVTVTLYAGFWGTEPSPGTAIFDNLNIAVPPAALSQGWVTGKLPFGGGIDAGTYQARTYFDTADWLWNPIPDYPVIDPDSDAIVASLASTVGGAMRTAGLCDYGVTLRGPGGIDGSTPRYDIAFVNDPAWGSDPFGGDTMGIPNGTPIPPGSDGHVSIADPTTSKVYSLWQATNGGGVWGASWGAMVDLHGDGRETAPGSSTATGLSRYAAVIRASEIASGEIPHALFFFHRYGAYHRVSLPGVQDRWRQCSRGV